MKKGFSYAGITKMDEGTLRYKYTKNPANSINYIHLDKYIYKGISYKATFYSLLQDDYTLFKSSIKQLGFILKQTSSNNQSTIYYFEKGNLEIQCWITINSYNIPDYFIVITDKMFEKKYFEHHY